MPDFSIRHHGSVSLVIPENTDAQKFLEDEVNPEPWQWFGPGLCVEPRYMNEFVENLRSVGFEIK